MEVQGKTIRVIVASEGALLTQANEVPQNERIFSSKVYGEDIENWKECSIEEAEQFIAEREVAQSEEL